MSSDALHVTVRDQMMEYLEGLLDEPARLALERHVAECEECARELELCRQSNRLAAAAITRPQLPGGFYQKLRQALPKPEHSLVTEQLHEYLEGMLPQQARRDLERHLADCESCSQELALARQAGTFLRDHLVQPRLPRDFYSRLRQALPLQQTQPLAAPETAPAALAALRSSDRRRGREAPPASLGASGLPARQVTPRPTSRRRQGGWGVVYGLLALAACVLVLCLQPSQLPMQPQPPPPIAAGTLAYGGGSIWLNGQPVTDVRGLQTGDDVETGEDSRAVLTLPGSGTLRLAPGTRVKIKSLNITTDETHMEVAMLRGRVWVEEDAPTRCAVLTRDLVIEPEGTIFDVQQDADGVRCNVFSGRVAMTRGTHTATLVPGQTGCVAFNAPGVSVGSITQEALEHDAFVRWNHDALLPASDQSVGQPLSLPTPVATPERPSSVPPPVVSTPPPAPLQPDEHHVIVLPPPAPGRPGVTVPHPRLAPDRRPDLPRVDRPEPRFHFTPHPDRPGFDAHPLREQRPAARREERREQRHPSPTPLRPHRASKEF
ncbi:MAG: zf-HC2 domain-containing protein [Candidatus Xenobia bacterium]